MDYKQAVETKKLIEYFTEVYEKADDFIKLAEKDGTSIRLMFYNNVLQGIVSPDIPYPSHTFIEIAKYVKSEARQYKEIVERSYNLIGDGKLDLGIFKEHYKTFIPRDEMKRRPDETERILSVWKKAEAEKKAARELEEKKNKKFSGRLKRTWLAWKRSKFPERESLSSNALAFYKDGQEVGRISDAE